MITKEQYDKALQMVVFYQGIIDEYQEQENVNWRKKMMDLNKGDYVKYIGGSKSNNLQKGKEYRLTCSPWKNRLAIINGAGRRQVYSIYMFEPII